VTNRWDEKIKDRVAMCDDCGPTTQVPEPSPPQRQTSYGHFAPMAPADLGSPWGRRWELGIDDPWGSAAQPRVPSCAACPSLQLRRGSRCWPPYEGPVGGAS
jgi:hypothetical protein